jgi:hypothetical protein
MKAYMGIRSVYLYPHLTSAMHWGVVYKEASSVITHHIVSVLHKFLVIGSQHDQSVFTASSQHMLLPFGDN